VVDPIDKHQIWEFKPVAGVGDQVRGGSIIGHIREHQLDLPIIIPPEVDYDTITSIQPDGQYPGDTVIARLEHYGAVGFYQQWQIRLPRPFHHRVVTDEQLITGQRIIDSLFPLTKGGTAIVSGGFGTGKTILEQSLAKFSRVDIIILVLIGERGNEVATVLGEFAELKDEFGHPLLDRTVVIANTSNMPVAAREASIYLGMTIGEYYRDLGLDVAILSDSMSRWAEAVREISGRLEEMPAEEGYPAYMSKALGEFFERAGKFETIAGTHGSITYIAAISPPGGDFTEPVTQAALGVTGTFWALSTELARSRHFPSIDWNGSFSQYAEVISSSLRDVYPKWSQIRRELMTLLKHEEELQQTVRLLGRDNLSEAQKGMLDMSRFVKDTFLQQDAFDPVDQDCSLDKQYLMLQILALIYQFLQQESRHGMTSEEFFEQDRILNLKRIHEVPENELNRLETMITNLEKEVSI